MSPARSHMPCRMGALMATVLCVMLSAGFCVQPAAAQSVWELTPYRVQVILAAERSPQLTPQFTERLGDDLLARATALIGAPWELDVVAAPDPLRRKAITGVENVTLDMLPEATLELDKVILLVVVPSVTGYAVTARELDVRTQTWGTPIRAMAWQATKLRDAAYRAICEAFAPLAQVATVDAENKLVILRLRASALPSRDTRFEAVAPGDFFLPVVRYNDREGNPRRISPVPWTFLRVEQTMQATLECRVHSGLRSPMTGRLRGRVERLALAVVPPQTPSKLTLKDKNQPEGRLAGYDVHAQALDSKATEFLGRTDRRGNLMIEPADPALRLLIVKHGGILLARLPVIPGLSEEIEALVPNDDQRLEAEGYLAGLQEDLIDLVVRRQLLIAQIRARLDAKDPEKADESLRELQTLKTRDDLIRDLNQEQQKIFAGDPGVQRQIDAMFTQTQKLLQQFLDPKTVEALTDEVAKALSRG